MPSAFRFPLPAPLALAALVAVLTAPAAAVAAGDATAGRIKAQAACNVCHGRNGLAVMPSAANLAGQTREYLVSQLQNFRNGKRQHEIMSVIASTLKDGEIEDLAAWFSSIPVEVKEPAQ